MSVFGDFHLQTGRSSPSRSLGPQKFTWALCHVKNGENPLTSMDFFTGD